MSDPLAASLSKFTPDASGLDRDALLFAAGRASAPPRRGWMTLAGVLAASQLVTLTLLVLPSTHPSVAPTQTIGPTEYVTPSPSLDRDGWPYSPSRAQELAAEDKLPAPEAVVPMVPDDPPLHAFTAPPSALFQ